MGREPTLQGRAVHFYGANEETYRGVKLYRVGQTVHFQFTLAMQPLNKE